MEGCAFPLYDSIAPSDDAWGFLVPVYHYQAGREREHGGAADPCPSSLSGNIPPRPGSRPLSTRFQEKPEATPIHGRKIDPCPFPEKPIPEKRVAPCVYTRARAYVHTRYIYVCRRKLLIHSDIRDFVIYLHLVKIY